MQDFIGLIGHKEIIGDSSAEQQTIKCTRNAAASIALVCAESSYEQSTLILNRLAGLELTAMNAFRITDSVGSELVREVPFETTQMEIKKMAEKINGNILEGRINQMEDSVDKDETIQKAIENGPEGIFHKDYDGPKVKAMYIECDGTGVPGRNQELAGVKGKQSDGSAKTFEAKIGTVFTVDYTADGRPLVTEDGEIYRDKEVNYMGTTHKVEDFGAMLYQHAVENGLDDMDVIIFLGDGAKWVWGIQDTYFPDALTGLDLYHSMERVNIMIDLLQFKGCNGADKKQVFKDECIDLLRCGKVQNMLDLIESSPCKKGNENRLESALGYFYSNLDRMNYGVFSACGIFVGSGVIESGCKLIVGNRMKNAGMHWSKPHAENMINLRCSIRNGDFLDSYLRHHTDSDDFVA